MVRNQEETRRNEGTAGFMQCQGSGNVHKDVGGILLEEAKMQSRRESSLPVWCATKPNLPSREIKGQREGYIWFAIKGRLWVL